MPRPQDWEAILEALRLETTYTTEGLFALAAREFPQAVLYLVAAETVREARLKAIDEMRKRDEEET